MGVHHTISGRLLGVTRRVVVVLDRFGLARLCRNVRGSIDIIVPIGRRRGEALSSRLRDARHGLHSTKRDVRYFSRDAGNTPDRGPGAGDRVLVSRRGNSAFCKSGRDASDGVDGGNRNLGGLGWDAGEAPDGRPVPVYGADARVASTVSLRVRVAGRG